MSRFVSSLLGGIALVAVGAAPTLAASPFDGAYVGAYTGYIDNKGSAEGVTGIDTDGWTYGGYAGFGKTFDQFYFGGEVEIGTADIDGKGRIGTVPATAKINESYGLAARVGFLASDNALFYGRVGWQRTNFEATAGAGASRVKADDTLNGLRVGGGLEYALTDNILTRVEYNYTNYEQGVRDNQVRVGIAYRF